MSLRICSIASGSKGNCYYIESEKTSLLVDLGISYKKMENSIKDLNLREPKDIFITHLHSDHINGIKTASKKGCILHVAKRISSETKRKVDDTGIVQSFEIGQDFFFNDITISTISVSHDVPCIAYSFISEGKKLAILTDIGCITEKIMDFIIDSDFVVLESNYDEQMLLNNNEYPEDLKRRIAGTCGHMSNRVAGEISVKLAKNGVRKIMLAHLSEKNNTPNIALENIKRELSKNNISGLMVYIAQQYTHGEIIEV